jgi:carbon-monoxide dehydrogenase medium subunit
MKPPLFAYIVPESLEEAVAARAAHEASAVLAGGQSLLPTLNFRIAAPDALIDLRAIPTLQTVAVDNGTIRIGAMVRQRTVELNDAVHQANPLIREALQNVAHIPIRNRGTIVGSLSHADAAAEMPALLVALDGAVVAHGPKGARTIAAKDLYEFHLTTSVAADEIVAEAQIPALGPRDGWAFREFARRRGDYAVAGICAVVTLGEDGRCAAARLAGCGIGSTPVRLSNAEEALVGNTLDETVLASAGKAARDGVTAPDDTQASTAYRKHVAEGLVKEAVREAAARARARIS